MVKKKSKWEIVAAYDDVIDIDARLPENSYNPAIQQIQNEFNLGGDEAEMGPDQKQALENKIETLRDFEQERGGIGTVDDQELVGVLRGPDEGLDEQEAADIVDKYRKQYPQVGEPDIRRIETPTPPQEMFPSPVESEFGGPNPPIPNPPVTGKYKGEYKKNKTKKHLKGKGPVADKANEIYHAIMREKGKAEPTKEEQASAAAIAWSQAKKTMKKKAYFRGEEAKVLDSYRGMWGEELVRLSVQGQTVDVPRDTVEFVDVEVSDPIGQLKEFVSHIPEEAETRSEILANIANLKTAKDIAYKLVVEGSADFTYGDEVSLDAIHDDCARKIAEFEDRLASDMTTEDVEYLESLPGFEIGYDVVASNFSQTDDGWMDEVIEKMAAEAEEIDVNKLVNEDPIVFVASLSEEVIADAKIIRTLASQRFEEVAGVLDAEIKKEAYAKYVEKAEDARRKAFQNFRIAAAEEVQNEHKIASDATDEGLFL